MVNWPVRGSLPQSLNSRFVRKGMQKAIDAACLSDYPTYHVGAALFERRKLVSIGWNTRKTHPACPTFSRHAEFSVLLGVPKSVVVGATVFVARVTRRGLVRMAKPCETCQVWLRAAGVKKVYFSNHHGVVEEYYV